MKILQLIIVFITMLGCNSSNDNTSSTNKTITVNKITIDTISIQYDSIAVDPFKKDLTVSSLSLKFEKSIKLIPNVHDSYKIDTIVSFSKNRNSLIFHVVDEKEFLKKAVFEEEEDFLKDVLKVKASSHSLFSLLRIPQNKTNCIIIINDEENYSVVTVQVAEGIVQKVTIENVID